jgi:hypothetical protein
VCPAFAHYAFSGSGSIPLTNGSGTGRPENIRILFLRIRFKIRIPNTVLNTCREVRQRQKEKKARGSKHEAAQIERQVKQQMEGQDPALVREVERQLVKHSLVAYMLRF